MKEEFRPIYRTVLTPIVLWLLTLVYIVLFPTSHYTSDAINNLYFLESKNIIELWHTQHLLAQWPGFWLYQLLYSLVGHSMRAWQAMRLAHAFLAGATVALVYAAVLNLTHRFWLSILCAIGLWFSYGFWHYQSDPDIYSLGYVSVALLMLAYIAYLQFPSTRRAVILGLTAALAILAHQINVLAVGLIGLSLIYWTMRSGALSRRRVAWHSAIYAGSTLLIVLAVYLTGWFSVNADYRQLGQREVAFDAWALRYFAIARTGQATWGVSSNLVTLPTAAYTFLSTWTLPPPVQKSSALSLGMLMGISIAMLGLAIHMAIVLRGLPVQWSLLVLTCTGIVLAEALAGWWWQAGNIKFYLFLQIPVILLAALYADQLWSHSGWHRRLGLGLLGVIWVGLALFHSTSTLPYETVGGVFQVAELARNQPVAIWFENQEHRRWFTYIAPRHAELLPPNFCQNPQFTSGRQWWIISEQTAANCPALNGLPRIGSYQADRSRRTWSIFEKNN